MHGTEQGYLQPSGKTSIDCTDINNPIAIAFDCVLTNSTINKNPLLMVKACRLTSLHKDWTLSDKTIEIIRKNQQKIYTIGKEYIRHEICTAISYEKPSNFLRHFETSGLLWHIMPDLAKSIGCEQNEYHIEPVWDHLLRSIDSSVTITSNPFIRLAILFHDIAKPHTKTIGKDGRIHFYKHEVIGANIVKQWMNKYQFTQHDIDHVTRLVRHHQWRHDKVRTRTARRWLNRIGIDIWRDLITLHCADRMGNLKNKGKPVITKRVRELITICERLENECI